MFRKFGHMSSILAAVMMSIGGYPAQANQKTVIDKPRIIEGKTLSSVNKVSQKKRRLNARRSGVFSK